MTICCKLPRFIILFPSLSTPIFIHVAGVFIVRAFKSWHAQRSDIVTCIASMIEASLVVTLTIVIAHGFGWLPNFITTPQFDETVQARCLFCRVITCAPRNHAYSICQQASHFYNSLFRTSLYSGAHCHIGSVQRFSSKAVLLLDVPYNPWIE